MIKFSLEKYPELNKFDDQGRNNFIEKIFDFGYNMIYNVKHKDFDISETFFLRNIIHEFINKIHIGVKQDGELLSSNVNNNSSYRKGEIAEIDLENSINNYFPQYKYIVTRATSNCGDAHIVLPDGNTIMLESKNYKSAVPQKEIDKMKGDMINTKIRIGLFISHTSNIANIDNNKIFDIIKFIDGTDLYMILCIPNYNNNILKLQCIFQLIPIIIQKDNNKISCNSLKIFLDELVTIVNQLKDTFQKNSDKADKILKNLNEIMLDYNSCINTISLFIMTKTNDYSKKEQKFNEIINDHINNKFINNIFKELCGLLIQYDCMLIDENKNKKYIIVNKYYNIGNVKVLSKKIIITFNNETNYDIDNNNNDLTMIEEQLNVLITK